MRMWYEPDSSASIKVRHKPTDEARSNAYRFEDGKLIWKWVGSEYGWDRASPENHPDWLNERLGHAHAKMDETEKSA